MPKALIVFATEDGQTAKVASRLAEALAAAGVEVALRDCARGDAGAHLAAYDGVVIGSGIHFGHAAKPLLALVKGHRAVLATRHTAFFSVSLSAGGPNRDPDAAKRHLAQFSEETGLQPDLSASFAGAIRHSRYGFLRTILAHFSLRKTGLPEPGDHEYTDWKAVGAFADAFAKRLASPKR